VDEEKDVAAALAFLQSRTPGPHYVAGYSFGAAVAGRALLQGLAADGAVFIAPPIAFMDLSFLPGCRGSGSLPWGTGTNSVRSRACRP